MEVAQEEAFVDAWMARTAEVRGVVFDFGGVISVSMLNSPDLFAYCARLGLDRAGVDAGWKLYRHLWDGGFITFEEMYRRIFADVGVSLNAEQYATLWELDAVGWIRTLRPETLKLMRRLKAKGKKVGILTNMSPDFYEKLFVPQCAAYRAEADVEVVSGLVHLCKPQREIYALMEARLGLSGGALFFVDDTEANVVAARTLGWQAEVYQM